jgi:Bacterial Ig-like domain
MGTDSVAMIRRRRRGAARVSSAVSVLDGRHPERASERLGGLAVSLIRFFRQVGLCWIEGPRREAAVLRGRRAAQRPRGEWLEHRLALSAPAAMVMLDSASTIDSKSVTIEYRVNTPVTGASPLRFGVYRSSDGQFDSSDALVDTYALAPVGATSGQAPTLDRTGKSAAAIGEHELTIPLPGGLPPYPKKPFVLVVANPSSPSATSDPTQTASFRVYTVGIVTHGGIQDPHWKHGPPWQLQIAHMMKHEGYDAVIPFNWVSQSNKPGAAVKQSPRLARLILNTAGKFPANAPVDLEFIAHSEGAVVNTYAIAKLQGEMTQELASGFIKDTLLDPHAANNHVASGAQMSSAGPLGGLAHMIITTYQGKSNDPPAYFPAVVDEAEVFYQHSLAKASDIYNLWGQVPVRSDGPLVHYYSLTAAGATHSGNTGVALWYRDFIAPTLGDQGPLVQQLQLDGQIENSQSSATRGVTASGSTGRAGGVRATRMQGLEHVVSTDQPAFLGTAAPGSVVRLYVGPAAKPSEIELAGRTRADAAGRWSLTARGALPDGQYRTVISAFSRALSTRPGLRIVPTQPLGRLVVDARPRS